MEEIYDTIFTDYYIIIELVLMFTIFICMITCLYKKAKKDEEVKKKSQLNKIHPFEITI